MRKIFFSKPQDVVRKTTGLKGREKTAGLPRGQVGFFYPKVSHLEKSHQEEGHMKKTLQIIIGLIVIVCFAVSNAFALSYKFESFDYPDSSTTWAMELMIMVILWVQRMDQCITWAF